MIELAGRVALVTGSSRGIGRAIALRLARAGADLVIDYVARPNAADEVAREILALGRRAIAVRADVSAPDQVERLALQVDAAFGRLDILVSNAATGGFRPLLDNTRQQLEHAFATNTWAFLDLLRAFLPLLTQGPGRGKVIALSSHGARAALPAYGLVGASKAALEALVRQAALELGPQGINVNAIVAGLIATESVAHLPDLADLLARTSARAAMGARPLTADDVADVALFLASPLADLVQGQLLVVDGGVGARLG